MSRLVRPSLVIIGILGAIFAPPWVPLICMVLLAFRYMAWEVLIMGMMVDFLWLPLGSHMLPLFTVAGLILAWGIQPLRKEFLFS